MICNIHYVNIYLYNYINDNYVQTKLFVCIQNLISKYNLLQKLNDLNSNYITRT